MLGGVGVFRTAPMASLQLLRRMRKKRDRAYQELGERIQREAALQTVARRMDLKRHLAGKGRRVKLNAPSGGAEGGRRYYRWKKERKR